MSTSCSAFAYAIEWSHTTFAATAALIGAATFALISDIAARSGSGSPASLSSSSRVRTLYSCSAMTFLTFLSAVRWSGALADVARLRRLRSCDGVVRQDVERGGEVDGDRHI